MPPPKKFKPPNQNENKSSKSKPKPSMSLSDADYEEIFDAVINHQPELSQELLNFKSPLIGKSPDVDAFSPKECASLENSQNSNSQKQENDNKTTAAAVNEPVISANKPKQINSESSNNQSESISTIYSEEFRKDAIFSTPEIKEQAAAAAAVATKPKQKSFREAVKNLKDTESQLSESLLGSLSQAQTSLNNSLLVDTPLSQPPANLNHRERLLWLQARRGDNVFVQCDACDKWRLSDVQDPVDLPNKWYCYMNKDPNFNNCSVPEQKLSIYVEADIIVNQYTAGTLVWAKIYSYPWWPAMVDDDPDTEQYYWIDDYDLNIPTAYNVTFFDGKNEAVTRAWISTKNLKSFKHNLTLDKKNPGNSKYKSRLRYAKEEAIEAMNLSIKERLTKYSFISKTKNRINTPVATPMYSPSDDDYNVPPFNPKIKAMTQRRYTVDDPVAQLKNSLMQKSKEKSEMIINVDKKVDKSKVTKKVTKRRNTTTVTATERLQIRNEDFEKSENTSENKETNIQRRRSSIPERYSHRDSSQETNEPKKVTTRRSTRAGTSTERDSSWSQDSAREKKITKRRTTICETSRESPKSIIDSNKLKKDTKVSKGQQRRKSIYERDSSQDLEEPKNVTRRRNIRGDTSTERDSSFSQDLIVKEKKITKRRSTISVYETKTSRESVIDKDSNKLEKGSKDSKAQRRRTSSIPERDNSQGFEAAKTVSRHSSIRGGTSVERDSSFSQDSAKEKKIIKRRKTICGTSRESPKDSNKLEKDTNKVSKKRNSISERDSSLDLKEPKKVSKRRNTRGDTSVERDSSFSQDLTKEKKIKNDNKVPKSRNSIPENNSSQDMKEPKKVTRRRNTRGDISAERDSSFSQDSTYKKKITNRRKTISEYEPQNSKESHKLDDGGRKESKIERRQNITSEIDSQRDSSLISNISENDRSRNTYDTSVERESSFSDGYKKRNKITKRRTTLGKHESENSVTSQKTLKEDLKAPHKLGNETQRSRKSLDRDSDVSEKNISKRRNTLCSEYSSQNSQNENKENNIKQRRGTIHENESQINISQNADKSQKIAKRRNTFAYIDAESSVSKDTKKDKKITKRRSTHVECDSQKTIKDRKSQPVENNPQNESKRRKSSTVRESQRDSSQNSDDTRKTTKRRNTRADSSIEKENTSSQGSKKEKKITKRRTTIAEYNYQVFSTEESENNNTQNVQENKVSCRRNTIEKDSSFTNSSIISDLKESTTKLDSNFAEENRLLESQIEPKKIRKTLGARKIVSFNKPKNVKGTESGYESAISVKKREEKKQDLSIILEESSSNVGTSKKADTIPKKRRQTTDEKLQDNYDDEELEITFTSLSQSLEQLDAEKRKKKFVAICQEIVNVDKDPEDPTISQEEKIFYKKLNTSLKHMKKNQDEDDLSDDKLINKVEALENKLVNIESKEVKKTSKTKDNFKASSKSLSNTTSTITSANTSMHSDLSENEIKTTKKAGNKRGSSDECQLKKKTPINSSPNSDEDL